VGKDALFEAVLADMTAELRGEALEWVCRGVCLQATVLFWDGRGGLVAEGYGGAGWARRFLREGESWYLLCGKEPPAKE
jgi:hypothetical protein